MSNNEIIQLYKACDLNFEELQQHQSISVSVPFFFSAVVYLPEC